jgi:hypothetical protein
MTRHQTMLAVRDLVHGALVAAAKDRSSPTWEADERGVMANAANLAAMAYGVPGRVTVDDIERLEGRAVGHSDYGLKVALYIAEFVMGWADV